MVQGSSRNFLSNWHFPFFAQISLNFSWHFSSTFLLNFLLISLWPNLPDQQQCHAVADDADNAKYWDEMSCIIAQVEEEAGVVLEVRKYGILVLLQHLLLLMPADVFMVLLKSGI
jgi:hypothetical protein